MSEYLSDDEFDRQMRELEADRERKFNEGELVVFSDKVYKVNTVYRDFWTDLISYSIIPPGDLPSRWAGMTVIGSELSPLTNPNDIMKDLV